MTKVFDPILDPGTATDKSALADALDERLVIAFTAASGVQTWTAGTPSGTQGVFVAGLGLYARDDSDTTSSHDGVTVLVSQDGIRFKQSIMLESARVLRSDLDTPPGSPVIGDAYLLLPAPTGAWAGNQNDIAVWTALGWQFITPTVGDIVYVENLDSYYRYTSGAEWLLGLGLTSVSAGSIGFRALQYPAGLVILGVLSTPPVGPTEGDLYLVGIDPTGDWVTHQNEFALWEGGAWTYVVAEEGWRVWDRSTAQLIYFDGSSWINALQTSAVARKSAVFTFGAGITPMTSAEGTEVGTIAFAVSRPANKVKVEGVLHILDAAGEGIAGVFFNEESQAAITIRPGSSQLDVINIIGFITPGDTATNVYKVRTNGTPVRLDLELTEVTPSS